MQSISSKAIKLETIQALRGLAAALIVVLHSYDEVFRVRPAYPFHIGVDIFFVISGFVMVYASREMFAQKGAWKEFLSRRAVRVIPLYWFYTTLLVGIALLMSGMLDTAKLQPFQLICSYLFIPAQRAAGEIQPFLALGWTLNYEMYFYAVFAALLFSLPYANFRGRLILRVSPLTSPRLRGESFANSSPRSYGGIEGGAAPLDAMLIGLTLFFAATVATGFFIPRNWHALYFWTRPIVLEFVAGAWIGWAYLKGYKLSAWTLLLFPAMAAGLAFIHMCPSEFAPWITQACAALAVALAVLPLDMDIASPPAPIDGLGDASYSIYLSHPFILTPIARFGKFMGAWPLFWACLLSALIGGYILYLLVEKPLISVGKTLIWKHEKAV